MSTVQINPFFLEPQLSIKRTLPREGSRTDFPAPHGSLKEVIASSQDFGWGIWKQFVFPTLAAWMKGRESPCDYPEPQGSHSQGSAGSGSCPSSWMRYQWHYTVKPSQLPSGVLALTSCWESWAKQKGFSTIVYFETNWRWKTGKHFLALIISLIERIMQLHADWFQIRVCIPYKRLVPSIWTICLDSLENCPLEKPAGISCVPAQVNALHKKSTYLITVFPNWHFQLFTHCLVHILFFCLTFIWLRYSLKKPRFSETVQETSLRFDIFKKIQIEYFVRIPWTLQYIMQYGLFTMSNRTVMSIKSLNHRKFGEESSIF